MGSEYKERRMVSGRLKAEQLKKTGAKIIIVACHNCFDQITDLNKKYELGLRVVSFKELIVESMIIPDEMRPAESESANFDFSEGDSKGEGI
jgi:Fe-S oxidoreductase